MTVIALAEATVDWLCLEPGQTMLTAANFYRSAGGNAANVAVGLSKLGVPTRLVAKIGDDLHGHYLRQYWQTAGVDPDWVIVDRRYPTAQCYMTVTADGQSCYSNWPRPNAAHMLELNDLDFGVLAGAAIVHTTGISLTHDPRRSAVLEFVRRAHATGSVISFDACFPTGQADKAREAALEIMRQTHLLKVNLAELRYWSGGSDDDSIEEMVERLLRLSSPVACIVTLGAMGAVVFVAGQRLNFEVHKTDCLCDVGAGDAFIAGMLYGLHRANIRKACDLLNLDAQQWASALQPAVICGALVTRAIGATESFPDRLELESLLPKLESSRLKDLSPDARRA